jgi:ankyrin repeat protein
MFREYKNQSGDWEYLDDNLDTQETEALFLILIRSLMDAGAAINPKVDESSLESLGGKKGDISAFDTYIHKSDIELRSVMVESHSPLTVASEYRNLKLVDIFLRKGADVNFRTKEGTSALQECLYSTEERALGCDDSSAITLKLLSKREPLFPGAKSLLRVIGVAQSLVDAGADIHGEICWCAWLPDYQDSHRHAGLCSTALDLSVRTESVVLVKIMLRAGANRTTKYSLECAIKMGDFELVELLLDIGSPLSPYAVRLAMRIDDGKIIGALLKARPDIATQRMVLVGATVLGNKAIINQVFERGVTKGRELLQEHHEMESALRDCCHSRYIATLRLIIDKFSMCNVSISPYLGGAVIRAVSHGYDHILDTLLSAGADVNAVFDSARTALVTAIEVQ